MDTWTFESLIAHLGADDLPRLAGLLDQFLKAREDAAAVLADRDAHFDGRLDAALVPVRAARRTLTALMPTLPERWAYLPQLGQLPPAGAAPEEDASAQELRAFRAFVVSRCPAPAPPPVTDWSQPNTVESWAKVWGSAGIRWARCCAPGGCATGSSAGSCTRSPSRTYPPPTAVGFSRPRNGPRLAQTRTNSRKTRPRAFPAE
jgi:hypothetical protein